MFETNELQRAIKKLHSGSVEERRQAVVTLGEALGTIEDNRAKKELTEVLEDPYQPQSVIKAASEAVIRHYIAELSK